MLEVWVCLEWWNVRLPLNRQRCVLNGHKKPLYRPLHFLALTLFPGSDCANLAYPILTERLSHQSCGQRKRIRGYDLISWSKKYFVESHSACGILQCIKSAVGALIFVYYRGKADFIQLVEILKAENQHSIQEHPSIYSAHRKIYDIFDAFFLPSNTKTCKDVGDSPESEQIAIPCNWEMLSCSQYPLISESQAVSVATSM